MLTAGLGGPSRHGCVALSDGERLVGVCEQERVTRVRGAGFNATGLPDEAFDTLLERRGRTRADVNRYVSAESVREPVTTASERIDHHLAHASAAYRTSPFDSSVVVVCDHEVPKVSVWLGNGADLVPVEWPWEGPGFSEVFSRCAAILGFRSEAGDQRMEALARLRPTRQESSFGDPLGHDLTTLAEPGWESKVENHRIQRGRSIESDAEVAAALQWSIGSRVVELLRAVHQKVGGDRLCLAGSLF
jgi:predicted NodU family carbamoyl transferase